MKSFLATFFVCGLLVWAFLFFGGALIVYNLFALIALIALVLTIGIRIYDTRTQDTDEKLAALEARCAALERAAAPREEPQKLPSPDAAAESRPGPEA